MDKELFTKVFEAAEEETLNRDEFIGWMKCLNFIKKLLNN